MSDLILTRRAALVAAGGLVLAGCDQLSQNATVQKVLSAKKYSGNRDQHAAYGYELAFALPAHRNSRENPASPRE